ncbi:MAG: HmuY family protein [Candidatus Tectomicrobia bacterium]|nr:HmuY family protein [Candidatus Tectomicrobia bacterium]
MTYTIDARSTTEWTYFDFSRGSTVEIWGRRSLNWDLAFQRNKIISNSGLTNPEGKGGIVELSSVDFESATEAPEEGYVTDTKTRDRIETENKAIVRWFDYSYTANTLKPKKSVYIIRTADGKYAKLKILSYYCEGHISGCPTIQYVYQGNGSRKFASEQAIKASP